VSREDEAIELSRIAWAQVERVLGIADPGLLGDLPDGGEFWVDPRIAPPLVGFGFDQAEMVLYFDFATQAVAQIQGDEEERGWDARGRPVQILDPPRSSHPGWNYALRGGDPSTGRPGGAHAGPSDPPLESRACRHGKSGSESSAAPLDLPAVPSSGRGSSLVSRTQSLPDGLGN